MDLFESIYRELNEELGISNLVKEMASNLIGRIASKYKTTVIPEHRGTLSQNMFGKVITVDYTVKEVEDADEAKGLKVRYPGAFTVTRGQNLLRTSVIFIRKDGLFVDYNGTTQHEIEHIYQTFKTGKSLLSKEKSKQMYIIALKLTDSDKYYDQIVGWSVYYACKFEKDAFMNTLYRKISDNQQEDPEEIIKETNLYNNLRIINDAVENHSGFSREAIENVCLSNFGKHFTWWKNLANKMVKAYMNKIGKVLLKVEKDRAESLVTPDKPIIEKPKFLNDNESMF